jgi:sarcosine oxidase, subunit gamma
MAEMIASALGAGATPGRYYLPPRGVPGATFRELTGRSMCTLRLPGAANRDDISGLLGCPLDIHPNTFTHSQTTTVLALGPDEWMLVAPGDMPAGLSQAARRAGGALVDIAGGWVAMAASGARIRDLLNKGCSLDLRLSRFPPGQCARTLFMRVSLIVLARADDEFELMFPTSYGLWVWQALCVAAQQWGYEVLAADEGRENDQ